LKASRNGKYYDYKAKIPLTTGERDLLSKDDVIDIRGDWY